MAVDLSYESAERERESEWGLDAERPASRRWAFEEALEAVRIVLWGEVGPRETAGIDEQLLTMRARSAPLLIDLTGVTSLHGATVVWLGLRHAEFGRERPMVVSVISDGRVHGQLTRPGAPQLRLTLE